MAAPKNNKFALGNAGGRPTLYTPERGAQFVSYVKDGISITAAAHLIGFSPQTIRNWIKANPDFRLAVDNAVCLRTFWLEWELRHATNATQARVLMLQLTNVCPEEYGRRKPRRFESKTSKANYHKPASGSVILKKDITSFG
jgi:hypothetical protein